MQMTNYPSVSDLLADNILIVDGPNGTKKISALEFAKALLSLAPSGMHRNIFRGKNLGERITDAQLAAIRNESFDDLFVGDYWVINSVVWRIVDINYWLHCGDVDFATPHLAIMPDTSLYSAAMNETNTTAGGYAGSVMRITNLNDAKSIAADAFGDAILSRRELLSDTVTNGRPTICSWYDSTVELPNEIMMYGSCIHSAMGNGNVYAMNSTTSKTQLALFKMKPEFISNRQYFWLRDIVTDTLFACTNDYGNAHRQLASTSHGVRPIFAVG